MNSSSSQETDHPTIAAEDGAPRRKPKSVPVSIVTGALGSGKTTLLNFILQEFHGKRIAVIENEFGEDIGVENLIAKDGANGKVFEDFFELNNGCICCSVKDDLVSTLDRLLERRDRFDYILVETSGMADPGPVASLFWVDDELESHVFLDGIVTVVDAKNFLRRIDDPNRPEGAVNEVLKQVAYADRIILNKQDLIETEDEVNSVIDRIREVNALAEIIWTTRSRLDLNRILDIRSFEFDRLQDVASLSARSCGNCGDDHHHHHHQDHHHHDVSVSTITIQEQGVVDLPELNRWLGDILWDREQGGNATLDQEIFRMKGFVFAIPEDDEEIDAGGETRSPKLHILQAVHELFECRPTEEANSADSEELNKIVVIGRSLQADELSRGFRACLR